MDHKKQHIRIVFVLTIVIMLGTPLHCLAEDALVFGGVPEIPPMSFEEDGVVKGFFSDVFREVAQRAGFEVTIELYPVKRLVVYLQAGQIDGVMSMVHTPEREKYLTYFPSPLIISRTLVFVKKGGEFPFKSIEDLEGKKIGVLLGWKTESTAFERAIQEGTIQIEAVVQQEQNLKKLRAGRVDCIIGTELVTWYYANELGLAEDLAALETPLAEHSVFSAISKNTKNISNPQEFIEKMAAALDEVLSDGTYEELQKKYKVTSLN